jgi:hypothetical protein
LYLHFPNMFHRLLIEFGLLVQLKQKTS